SGRRHTSFSRDWSSDVCSSDLHGVRGRAVKWLTRNQVGYPLSGDIDCGGVRTTRSIEIALKGYVGVQQSTELVRRQMQNATVVIGYRRARRVPVAQKSALAECVACGQQGDHRTVAIQGFDLAGHYDAYTIEWNVDLVNELAGLVVMDPNPAGNSHALLVRQVVVGVGTC